MQKQPLKSKQGLSFEDTNEVSTNPCSVPTHYWTLTHLTRNYTKWQPAVTESLYIAHAGTKPHLIPAITLQIIELEHLLKRQ